MPSVDLAIAPSAAIQIASLQAPDRLLLPEVDTTSFTPPPAPEPKPEVKAEPEPKPDEVQKPKPESQKAEEKTLKAKKTPKAKVATAASAPVREQKAAGTGGTSQAGVGKNDVTTLGKGQERKLFAKWGARIRSKVERQQRYPRGQKGKAKVIVKITVSNSGQLKGVRVARSSGNQAYDKAALAAVKRARKFPKAPKGLNAPSYAFNLPITFIR
nr:TonB family protein [Shimia sp. CNT1-13L.2]